MSFNTFKSGYDEEDSVPDLQSEWLDNEERRKRESAGQREVKRIRASDNDRMDLIRDKSQEEEDFIVQDDSINGNTGNDDPRSLSRNKRSPDRLEYKQLGGEKINLMGFKLSKSLSDDYSEYKQLMALLSDSDN